ncbi:MAG: fasciclin domain-containing protein [Pacificimonas sp.]
MLGLAACDPPEPDPRLAVEEEPEPEPLGPPMSQLMSADGRLSTLSSLFKQTNMEIFVDNADSVTLLAPINEAFDGMEPTARDFLLAEENVRSLKAVLGIHMLRSDMAAADLAAAIDGGADLEASLMTSNSFQLTASRNDDGDIVIADSRGNEATVVATDVQGANGRVHLIDTVLLPPE